MPNETKHTPGPWVVYGTHGSDGRTEFAVKTAFSNEAIAQIECEGRERANAILIAEAPNMLEALQMVMDAGEGNPSFGEVFDRIDFDRIERLIRRAEDRP